MGLGNLCRRIWTSITADTLAAWPHDHVRVTCQTCGLDESRNRGDLVDTFGPGKDLNEIVSELRSACGKAAKCHLTVEGLEIPRFYR